MDGGVIREQRTDFALEAAEGRPAGKAKQVRRTRAIRSSEAVKRHLGARQLLHHLRPLMLAAGRVVRVPYAFQSGMQTQMVDVPVRPRRPLAVMRQSRAHAAGSKGAADVDVPTGPQRQVAQPPDAQATGFVGDKDQRIGSRAPPSRPFDIPGYSESNTSLATRTALAAVGQPA